MDREIKKYIDDELSHRFISSWWELLFWIVILIFFGSVVYEVIITYRHNSDVDYRNEQLKFCSNIYNSDHVILEQCKDYFIILGER